MAEVVIVGNPFVNPDTSLQTVQDNATLTASGTADFSGIGAPNIALAINIVNVPTGTSPTIQFDIQQIDEGDGTTLIGTASQSTVITGVTNETITLAMESSSQLRVTWTLGGTSPSFTGVYVTLVNKWEIITTTSGSTTVQGLGTAGSPVGNLLTVQGDAAGTPMPISGTVTANNASVDATGGAVPSEATYLGGNNAGNLIGLVADSSGRLTMVGAGTAGTPAGGVSSVQGVSGGTLLGTNVAQWIGSVAPTVGQKAMAASLPVAVASDQSTLTIDVESWLGSTAPTVGQKAMAASVPMVLASDQSIIEVDGSGVAGTPAGGVL